jgi:hypothetical protein
MQRKNAVEHHRRSKDEPLRELLTSLLPDAVPPEEGIGEAQGREEFLDDIFDGLKEVTMSLRLMLVKY